MKSSLFIVIALIGILTISGCVNTPNRPEEMMNSFPEVSEFLADHPDSELQVLYRSEASIRADISEVTEDCGQHFRIADYWNIILSDPHSDDEITLWIDKDTRQLACLYGEGGAPPKQILPVSPDDSVKVSGFSNLEVGGSSTRVTDGMFYLDIRNPVQDRISINKVTATYLDDIKINETNSGILNKGQGFTYGFDLSRTIEDDSFWIDVEVSYQVIDENSKNQKSRGSVIRGLDSSRILLCTGASLEMVRDDFYFVTRVYEIEVYNTGDIDLKLDAYWRGKSGKLEKVGDPMIIGIGDSELIEIEGLTQLHESVVLVSQECPGENIAIFTSEIPGL